MTIKEVILEVVDELGNEQELDPVNARIKDVREMPLKQELPTFPFFTVIT